MKRHSSLNLPPAIHAVKLTDNEASQRAQIADMSRSLKSSNCGAAFASFSGVAASTGRALAHLLSMDKVDWSRRERLIRRFKYARRHFATKCLGSR